MATLNSVEFGIINKNTTVIHDNNITDIPGSDTVVNDDAGYSTGPMQITGHVKNESEFDDFKGEFYGGGDLTLISDPDSGKQYTVYAASNVTELDGDDTYPLSDIVFQCVFFMKYPYLESVTEVTRTKTITTNNQEWSADDDGSDLKTEGNVNAVPNIQVTGGAPAATLNRTYGIEDGDSDATEYTDTDTTYSLKKTMTFVAKEGIAYYIDQVSAQLRISTIGANAMASVRVQAASLYGGAETEMCVLAHGLTGYELQTHSPDLLAAVNEQVIIRWYLKASISSRTAYMKDTDVDLIHYRKDIALEPLVYNTADTTVKSAVANEILEDAIHTINTDGAGTVTYADDFTTNKYSDAFYDSDGVTYDDPNNELDLGTNGYIFYKIDTKYPITGIPVFTATIDIDTGTPTIQIAADSGGSPDTWYDIDTAIVDDVDTGYPLDNASNLSLAGETIFYFRIDCGVAATCSVESVELNIDIHTVYAKNPMITKGATASTFRCDQDAASGMNCEVSLIYPARWWA